MRLTIPDVAIVVVPAGDSSGAVWRGLVKRRLHLPLASVGNASSRVVVLRQSAVAFVLHILRLCSVVFTTLLWLLRQDGNVVPRGWMPVGKIVSFLGAFQTMTLIAPAPTIAIGVLPSGCSATILLDLLIRRKKPLVALALNAGLVEVVRLMIAPGRFSCFLFSGIIAIAPSAVLVSAIAHVGIVSIRHVLEHDLAPQVWMPHATAMLHMPLQIELRPLVELHSAFSCTFHRNIVVVVSILAGWLAVISDLVSGRCVVLRVKQPVCVLHVVALFTKLVVGSSWTVQVHVRIGRPDRCEQQGRNYSECHDCHGSKWFEMVQKTGASNC
mmetsp:Transcript_61341/g.134302  ORF Transcript_61341/g.134302 Transcript_61341/m.134302 type:complete len:327 (-) Transcript_61341:16-996(-)